MYGMNTVEQDNINFLLNKYKDIIRNDDGTFRLAHRCIPGDTNNSVHFVNTGVHNHNELEHNCYRCKHCEPEDRACHDRCLLRTRLELNFSQILLQIVMRMILLNVSIVFTI